MLFRSTPPRTEALPPPAVIANPSPRASKSPWARPHAPTPEARPSPAASPPPPPAEPVPSPAPAQSLADLPPVSASDWVQKVAESAQKLDVIVVFHSIAHSGSDAFQFAFRTMIQEVLPRLGRPYVAYRFSLDAEPSFVTEMAECLGLPSDSVVTGAGIFWSGPRRRLSLMGDRAFESRAAFSGYLQATLISQHARLPSGILPGAAPTPARAATATPTPVPSKVASRRRIFAAAWLLMGMLVAAGLLASTAFDWRRSPPPLPPEPVPHATPSATTQLPSNIPEAAPRAVQPTAPAAPPPKRHPAHRKP